MSESNLTQHQTVKCIFNPERTDDLYPEALEAIGKEFTLMASWIVEDGDYEGQWALTPRCKEGRKCLGWVPEQDVTIIKGVGDESSRK